MYINHHLSHFLSNVILFWSVQNNYCSLKVKGNNANFEFPKMIYV